MALEMLEVTLDKDSGPFPTRSMAEASSMEVSNNITAAKRGEVATSILEAVDVFPAIITNSKTKTLTSIHSSLTEVATNKTTSRTSRTSRSRSKMSIMVTNNNNNSSNSSNNCNSNTSSSNSNSRLVSLDPDHLQAPRLLDHLPLGHQPRQTPGHLGTRTPSSFSRIY
jgi:hypothetical protein